MCVLAKQQHPCSEFVKLVSRKKHMTDGAQLWEGKSGAFKFMVFSKDKN